MAKVKGMAATNYVGKLGPQIFYMRDGQNVVREKAASVSNPKTDAQMNQRIKFGNLINLYRLNKEWMEKYAFPLRPAKQSVYNAFMSANLANSTAVITKEDYQAGVCILEPLEFTKGNLRQMTLTYNGDVAFVSDINIGAGLANYSTIAQISTALLNYNSWLRDGDQISIVFNVQTDSNIGRMYAAEFTINQDDGSDIAGSEAAPFFDLALVDASFNLKFNMDALPDSVFHSAEVVGAVLIVSRVTAEGVKVTSSRMTLSTDEVLENYSSEAARRSARRSYGGGEGSPFLTPGYGDLPVDVATLVAVEPLAGRVTVNGTAISRITVPLGLTVTLGWTGAEGYTLDSYTVDGQTIDGNTFTADDERVYEVSANVVQTE